MNKTLRHPLRLIVKVWSLTQIETLATDQGQLDKLDFLISILNPRQITPAPNFRNQRLTLTFDDISLEEIEVMELSARGREAAQEMLLMTPGDVQKSIWFCRAAIRAAAKSLTPVTLVLHCQFGISRSATLALVALHLLNGKDPARALAQLLEIQPDFWPNMYLVSLVDEAFNLGGRLSALVERFKADHLSLRGF